MLWTIAGLLVVLWILGSVAHVGGTLIHLLLVIAVIADGREPADGSPHGLTRAGAEALLRLSKWQTL